MRFPNKIGTQSASDWASRQTKFKSDESYREKLGQIKESYFGTPKTETVTEVASEESAPVAEKQLETVSESMAAYVEQLAKRI